MTSEGPWSGSEQEEQRLRALALSFEVVYFIGIWMLTAPEPGHKHRVMGLHALSRVAGIADLTADAVLAAVSHLPNGDLA